jgi:hypothetical protein
VAEFASYSRTHKTLSLPVTAAVVFNKGMRACIDTSTGLATIDAISTTLIPIGYFMENGTGDGVTKAPINLFREINLDGFANNAANPVDGTDIGSTVYISGVNEVSSSSNGSTRSSAGRAIALHPSYGVLVDCGLGVTGPTGASGNGLASASVADRTALAAISAANRSDGMLALVKSDGALYRFDSASAVTEDESKQLVVAPAAGSGRWLRADKTAVLKLAFTNATADTAPLLTVPAGFVLRLAGMPFWEVTTGLTGGTSSAIGVSASAIATTKGDLLGGAAGDVTATLGTSGIKAGTIGPKIDTPAEVQAFFLKAADFIRFDRITSAFTAGAGNVCVPVAIMPAA